MHAAHLVEFAALVASHRAAFEQPRDISFWSAEDFWAASRSRLYEWAAELKACQAMQHQAKQDRQLFWNRLQPVLEEIFLAEVCTRVWCANLSIVDRISLPGELDPIARSVFVANLEARRRALGLLLFSRGLSGIATNATNRLRRDCELWTDIMLARFSPSQIAQQYGFEKRRIRNYAQSFSPLKFKSHVTWNLELLGMRQNLASRQACEPVCGDLNAKLGETLLSCLPKSIFDGVGVMRPGWTVDAYNADGISFNIAADLCGNSIDGRYHVGGCLKDRR